jgi:hypothetical protein
MDAPWSTKGAIILEADHQDATEWSIHAKPIIRYHKAPIHHTLHSVIVDDDPKSTGEAIQAPKPNNATRLEQLANEITVSHPF